MTVVERNDVTLSTPEVATYAYDLMGNLVRVDLPNGIARYDYNVRADWRRTGVTETYYESGSPETNPIERVWCHLHETITRNHRCQALKALIRQAVDWFRANNNHYLDIRHAFAKAA